jgi:hypothetical protein
VPSDDEKKHGEDARDDDEEPAGGEVGHGGGGGEGKGGGLGRTEVMRLGYVLLGLCGVWERPLLTLEGQALAKY